MLLIGLTGGIATGKSTASQHLTNSTPPIPIIDADLIARQVITPHRPAYYSLVRHFGLQIINPETLEIDRAKLGAIVFSGDDVDGRQRKVLNGITHPDIRAEMLHCALKCFLRGERMCVLDTPLLFEAGLWKVVNVVMVVYCSEQAQLARLTARDSLTPTDAKSRIASQMPIDEKRQRADILIDNSSATPDDMRAQLDAAVTKLRPGRIKTLLWWSLGLGPAVLLYAAVTMYVAGKGVWARWRARKLMAEVRRVDTAAEHLTS